MKLFMVPAVVGLLALPGVVLAAPAPERIRGTIDAVDAGSMTVHTIDGTTATIALNKDTKVVSLVKSSLSAITDGSFVGTATKGDNPPTALEIHIFPEAMRGTGEGHRDWDTIPDTLAGGGRVKSAMTNGTVKAGGGGGGERTLTVDYGKGQSLQILVPPQAPVVSFEPASASALAAGAKVFVIAARGDDGRFTARRVAVGKDGLTPPM